MTVRILIVDDSEIFRTGLRAFVEAQADWEVCGEARDGLFEGLLRHRPRSGHHNPRVRANGRDRSFRWSCHRPRESCS